MNNSVNYNEVALNLLNERGIRLEDIADLVMYLQNKYVVGLTQEECLENVKQVLTKREVQMAVITGIELDRQAENAQFIKPLNDLLMNDEPLYGLDEILALAIVNVYGSIGFTNYGYIDKVKPGILEKLNEKDSNRCHTFLDDIVGAIAASAASRIAHSDKSKQSITH